MVTHWIFIIDDEHLLREAYRRFLEPVVAKTTHARLRVFESPHDLFREAASLAAPQEPCQVLLISDGNMASLFGLEGDELIRRTRNILGDRLARAVIISGNPRSFADAAKELGAELRAKPVQARELCEMVGAFIRWDQSDP